AADRRCRRRFAPGDEPMRRYLAALERVMAGVVTYGDVLLPPADAARAAEVHRALAAAADAAPGLRRALAEARAAGTPSALVDAEERLVDYTAAVAAAIRDWIAAATDADQREQAVRSLF